MLHLVTPLFRLEHLDHIYASWTAYPDVIWHIAKIRSRPALTNAFLADPRVHVYELDCPDNDTIIKRNHIFDQIQEGHFYLLDDDTRLHPNLYPIYEQYRDEGNVGMLVGGTYRRKMGVTHKGVLPVDMHTIVDTGMGLSHHIVLRHVRWAYREGAANDRFFWHRCYLFFGPEATRTTPQTIAYYNYFGPHIRVRKRLLGHPVAVDIYSGLIAWPYHQTHRLMNLVRWVFGYERPLYHDDRFLKR